jgi:hypothetical protein
MIVWPETIILNKYTKWYEGIIQKAINRGLPAVRKKLMHGNEYTELHHIIPRSLGGSNEKSNLIRLTGREHFICHWLLTKMTVGIHRAKMVTALIIMTGAGSKSARYSNINKNSRWFSNMREEYAKQVSEKNKGKIISEETREKLRIANTGRKMSDDFKKRQSERQKGKPRNLSEEGRKRLIEALQNRVVVVSEETKKKHSINNSGEGNPFYGKTHSNESLTKMKSYHNDPLVKLQKSERVQGDKNPAKRNDVRESISKSQRARLDKERELGIGYFSPEQHKKRKESQSGPKNGNAKTYECVSPLGEVFIVIGGIKKFCKEHNLNYYAIVGQTSVSHRGWSILFIPKT